MGRWRVVAGVALCAGLIAPAAAQAKTTLVEVRSADHAVLDRLEALGLDVTYEGSNRTEVMLHGPEDAQLLEDTGYPTKVLIEDMDGVNDARLEREAESQARVDAGIPPLSGLPTGRVAYRTYTDIQAEIQQIAATYPDKVKLFTPASGRPRSSRSSSCGICCCTTAPIPRSRACSTRAS
jgi:hypothetical protein